jgi:hypothetical protein
MKVGQNTLVRWVSKLVAKDHNRKTRTSGVELESLSADQLRRVSGGTGTSTATPTKTW